MMGPIDEDNRYARSYLHENYTSNFSQEVRKYFFRFIGFLVKHWSIQSMTIYYSITYAGYCLPKTILFFFQLQGKEKFWSIDDSFIHYALHVLCESLCYNYYVHSTYLYFVYTIRSYTIDMLRPIHNIRNIREQ